LLLFRGINTVEEDASTWIVASVVASETTLLLLLLILPLRLFLLFLSRLSTLESSQIPTTASLLPYAREESCNGDDHSALNAVPENLK
jgi:hypothetical protein